MLNSFVCVGLELEHGPSLLGASASEPGSRSGYNVGELVVAGRQISVRPHLSRGLEVVRIGTVMTMPAIDMSVGLMPVLVIVATFEMAPTWALVLHAVVVGLGSSTSGMVVVVRVM